jgi:hypothetical protein
MRGVLIAASLVLASPTIAQQVRVIKGEIEHVYGPGAQILDDADLQARNQRAWEHMQAEQQLAIQRRQLDIEEERLKLQREQMAALAYAPSADAPYGGSLDSYGGWWDGGGFIGPTRGFFRRGVIRPKIGILPKVGGSPRMGGSRR